MPDLTNPEATNSRRARIQPLGCSRNSSACAASQRIYHGAAERYRLSGAPNRDDR